MTIELEGRQLELAVRRARARARCMCFAAHRRHRLREPAGTASGLLRASIAPTSMLSRRESQASRICGKYRGYTSPTEPVASKRQDGPWHCGQWSFKSLRV